MDMLTSHHAVVELDMSQNQLSFKGANQVARLLNRYHQLTTLNVEGNALGGQSATAMGSAIVGHQSLTALNLGNNMLGLEGAKVVAMIIQDSLTLRDIRLGDGNDFTEEGGIMIRDSLSKASRKLQYFSLHDSTISLLLRLEIIFGLMYLPICVIDFGNFLRVPTDAKRCNQP